MGKSEVMKKKWRIDLLIQYLNLSWSWIRRCFYLPVLCIASLYSAAAAIRNIVIVVLMTFDF